MAWELWEVVGAGVGVGRARGPGIVAGERLRAAARAAPASERV